MLLCGPAGDIALKDVPASATAGQPMRDAGPQGLIRMMMEKNGQKVQVCAIYLPSKAADASILLDGVTVAAPDAMWAAIVAPGTSLLTFSTPQFGLRFRIQAPKAGPPDHEAFLARIYSIFRIHLIQIKMPA
jgi:hypothetical protein